MAKSPRPTDRSPPSGLPESPRELIVLTRAEADIAASPSLGVRSRSGMATNTIMQILADNGAGMAPLFGASEARARAGTQEFAAFPGARDMGSFYRVTADDAKLDAIATALAATEPVEAAYVKPPTSPATIMEAAPPLTDEPPAVTPDFASRQGYLDAAPAGVDARWAWTQPGGRGTGVNIIDVEGAWRFTHEDLTGNQGGVVGGTQSSDILWRDHGTAVIGVFGGDVNGFGIVCISSDARTSAVSIFGPGNSSAAAIRAAASRLNAGDILLIELHRPGPRFAFAGRPDDQQGYIAVEWWPDDFAAILFATSRGVIVVEAAGNGAQNLDDGLYNTPAAGFPSSWRNPFNRANPDCGAVMVGAGAPATLNFGPDRSRLDFSNFGSCLDAQGWGRDVVTSGYGDLQGGANEDLWYTARFSGTSSASPVVVGALACVQGILRARSRPLLTPATARQRLRTTGSPQQDAPGRPATQRIGNRPDIRGLISALIPKPAIKDAIKEGAKDIKEKDVKEGKEVLKDRLKDGIKEGKEDKEGKEFKEQIKDSKDFKELDKRIGDKFKDRKDSVEKFNDGFDRQIERLRPTAAPDLEARVAALEAQVNHFIEAGLRPDVGAALYEETTAEAQRLEDIRQEAEAQYAAAKDAKDMKDREG